MSATEVEISFFKPQGFADTYVVDTEDRGLAMVTVLDLYRDDPVMRTYLPFLNYVTTRHTNPGDNMLPPRSPA